MSAGIKNQIGPFMYADGALRRRTVGGVDYLVGIAGAYNAYGLIGPEHNGIFVLDATNKQVVLDRYEEQSSGYNGPSEHQWAVLGDIMRLDDADFIEFITTDARSRLAGAA